MQNKKTFIAVLVGFGACLVGLYMLYQPTSTVKNPESPIATGATAVQGEKAGTQTTTDLTKMLPGSVITIAKEGKTLQTLIANQEALKALPENKTAPFIVVHDVNFDGNQDIAVLVSVDSEGKTYSYEYYLYTAEKSMFAKSDVLEGTISNPVFDLENKKIVSWSKDGAKWYMETLTWDGAKYIRGAKVEQKV